MSVKDVNDNKNAYFNVSVMINKKHVQGDGRHAWIFGQNFWIGFFLGRVSGDFWGFWGVNFGGFVEAFSIVFNIVLEVF